MPKVFNYYSTQCVTVSMTLHEPMNLRSPTMQIPGEHITIPSPPPPNCLTKTRNDFSTYRVNTPMVEHLVS
jgi:hypothetical protein